MMTSLTHQVQGSYAASASASRPLSLRKRIDSNKSLITFSAVKKSDIILLKHRSCLCVKVPLSNRKSLKISSFKGNIQNDESGERENVSKSTNSSVKLSYVSKDCNEAFVDSSKMNNNHAVQQLFRSWLTLLRAPSKSQTPDGILEAGPFSNEMVEDRKIQNNGIWRGFLGLDLAIKIPAMIFIPMYLVVNMKYGPGVARELTPLWICGPPLVALYIKIVRGLCSLYIYSFKQFDKVMKNLHLYYDYAINGKPKEYIHARLWLPVTNFRNLGYKGIWARIQEWIVDKYLDYIESIWPHYCKFIRFMKRANFI